MAGRVKVQIDHAPNLFYHRVLLAWKTSLAPDDRQHHVLFNAAASLKRYPLPIQGIADLKRLKGIGDQIAVRLDACWEVYVENLGKEPTHRDVKALKNDDVVPLLGATKSAKAREKEKRRGDWMPALPGPSKAPANSDDEFREPDAPPKKRPNIQRNNNGSQDKPFRETPGSSLDGFGTKSQTAGSSRADGEEVQYLRIRPDEKAEVILLCDNREVSRKFKKSAGPVEHLMKLGIRAEVRTLPVGDFMWVLRRLDGQEMAMEWVVERKTWDDLSHSIIGGRYGDQKRRLRQAPMSNRVYLVEGRGNGDVRCNQALATTLTHDHYLVQRCETAKDTAHFLEILHHRLVHQAETNTLTGVRYDDLGQFAKSSSVQTVRDSWVQMLQVCPGMSQRRAEALAARFPSLPSLVSFLRSGEDLQTAAPCLPKSVMRQLMLFFQPQLDK
ncbi:unnamed protein product, partial [Mesorhabditis spiculigera]